MEPFAPPDATISEALGHQTNNVAEWTGVVRALELARRLGAERVDLFLDSKLIVEQLHGRWRVKDAKLQPLWAEAKARSAASGAGLPRTSRGPRTPPPTGSPTRPWIASPPGARCGSPGLVAPTRPPPRTTASDDPGGRPAGRARAGGDPRGLRSDPDAVGGGVPQLRSVGGNPAAAVATIVLTATDVVIQTGCNTGAGAYVVSGGSSRSRTSRSPRWAARGALGPPGPRRSSRWVPGPRRCRSRGHALTIDPGAGGPVLVFDRTSGA